MVEWMKKVETEPHLVEAFQTYLLGRGHVKFREIEDLPQSFAQASVAQLCVDQLSMLETRVGIYVCFPLHLGRCAKPRPVE